MPLQVIFSTSSKPPEPITLVSAGDDLFTFCSEEITLQAVLIGPEFGHTFLWELVPPSNPTGVVITVAGFPGCNGIVEVTDVTLPVGNAEVNFLGGGQSWQLDAPTNDYYVWYTLDGGGADPAPGGKLAVGGGPVALVTGDSDVVVRTKTSDALNLEADFNAVPAGLTVTVTNTALGGVPDAVDVDANVGILVTQQGDDEACAPGPVDESTLYYYNHAAAPDGIGTFDDKVWKFTVDKGTAFEQIAFVTVFGGPISQFDVGQPQSGLDSPRLKFGSSFDCRTPKLRTLRNFPPVEGPEDGTAECASTSYVLSWTMTCPDRLTGFQVQEKSVTGPFSNTPGGTLGPDARKFFAIDLNKTYRVVAFYEDFGTSSTCPSNVVFTNPNPEPPSVEHFNEDISGLTQLSLSGNAGTPDYAQITNYNIQLISLLTNCADGLDDYDTGGNAGTTDYVQIPNFNVVLLTILRLCADGLDDYDTGGNAGSLDYTQMTDFNVQDLRGGDIGG